MADVKFGIFADLHVDIMHDCQERMEKFLNDCERRDVDFVIQLGDFVYPDKRDCRCDPEKRPVNIQNALDYPTFQDKEAIVGMYRNFKKPSYHCFGNHDLDMCSKEDMYAFLGNMDRDYYSFDRGGVHFVVLDPCYYMDLDGKLKPFDNGMYFNRSYDKPRRLPYLPPEQIEWLRGDLAKTEFPSVLFSHQGLRPGRGNILNADEVMPVIEGAPNGVILAANGHLHKSTLTRIGGTWFWNVNSMDNLWLDIPYRHESYPHEIHERFPNIEYTFPYADPLYAIVTVKDGMISIDGTKSRYVGPSPAEMGYKMNDWDSVCAPEIHSYDLSW